MIKAILLAHTLMELGAGLVFVFAPQIVPGLEEVNGMALTYLKSYGYAAIGIGMLGLMALLHFYKEGALPVALFTMAVFHGCISIAQINTPLIPAMQIEPMILHGSMSILSGYFYLKER